MKSRSQKKYKNRRSQLRKDQHVIRIIAMLVPDQAKKDQDAASAEYSAEALKCDAIQISKQPGIIRLTFKFASACTSALLKKIYKDDRIERVDVDQW
jgi:hypothetical protein